MHPSPQTDVRLPRRWLALALAAALPAHAQEHASQHAHASEPVTLGTVEVRATPLADTAEKLTTPVEILTGARLDAAKAATLGDTVAKLPGVQSTSFGAGVGRPIIRGLDGARVQVLSDGLSSGDVSTLSVDHAVSIEPFLADQIEVLKGPATLLYGSGAIGGAVNVVDGRIPESLGEAPFSGRAELRAGTASNERTGMLRLDGNAGTLAFHFDALQRNAGDYAIPGYPTSAEHLAAAGETPDPDSYGRLANSALHTASAAFGASWIGEGRFLGASYGLFNTRYGIPGGAHQHGGEHEAHAQGQAEEHDEHGHGEEAVTIHLDQRRSEMRGGWDAVGPFQSLRLKLADTRYSHTEYEGASIGTVFHNESREARLELVHAPWASWDGALGLQASHRDFEAIGDEAFVPASVSRDLGVFWIGRREVTLAASSLQLDVGLRHDRVRLGAAIAPTGHRFANNSASMGLTWHAGDVLHLNLGLDRAQRAPGAEELYSSGLHVATGSFELGHAGLDAETANRVELGVHLHHGPVEARLSAWQADYDDFIYLADTDLDVHGAPLRIWRQDDARFRGLEAALDWDLLDNRSGLWSLNLFADAVRARLARPAGSSDTVLVEIPHGDHAHHEEAQVASGGNLPRIAPARFGANLRWERDAWRASLGAVRYARQDRVALHEDPTPGYTLVDAHLAWHLDGTDGRALEVFMDAGNLTNQEARPHTSLLKELVPLPGRNVALGVRLFF